MTPAKGGLVASDDAGADRPALGGGAEVALAENVEHHDGNLIVHAKGKGSGVHDLKPAAQGVAVGDRLEALSPGVGAGIGVVDAVYLGGLEESVGSDFAGPKSGGGVGGEERVAGAGGKDDHASFIEVAEGPAANKGFGHIFHFNSGHDAGLDPSSL